MNLTQRWRTIAAILLTGVWVNASEFFRNEVLLKTSWTGHYQSIGLTFPSAPRNAMLWVAWGFLFAAALYLISRKFSLMGTALISWFMAFVLMWVVTFNLGVLPIAILAYAVPLSLLEAFVGAYLCLKISPNQ